MGTLSRQRFSAFHQHPHGVGHREGYPSLPVKKILNFAVKRNGVF